MGSKTSRKVERIYLNIFPFKSVWRTRKYFQLLKEFFLKESPIVSEGPGGFSVELFGGLFDEGH
jgi:hypothetical protein